MAVYGYKKGALSKAAEHALDTWTRGALPLEGIEVTRDPIAAIQNLLKPLKESGVELQHAATRLRASHAMEKG